jgi:hypothetical protein
VLARLSWQREPAATPESFAMKFYTVIFEENGETVSTFSIHAKSELEAKLAAERYFRDDSELSKLLGNEEVTIRVEEVRSA